MMSIFASISGVMFLYSFLNLRKANNSVFARIIFFTAFFLFFGFLVPVVFILPHFWLFGNCFPVPVLLMRANICCHIFSVSRRIRFIFCVSVWCFNFVFI